MDHPPTPSDQAIFHPFPASVFLLLETVFTIFSFLIEHSVYPCDSDCVDIHQGILN